MRQFRGWDKKSKKFFYEFIISPNGAPTNVHSNEELNKILNDYYATKGDDMWGDYGVVDFTDWYAIDGLIVEMSTDTKDKTGREIYENDYVEFFDIVYLVKFQKGCFMLDGKKEIWWHEINLLDIESSMKIVGNIHEERKTKLNILNKI
jgi:hypothetical protein